MNLFHTHYFTKNVSVGMLFCWIIHISASRIINAGLPSGRIVNPDLSVEERNMYTSVLNPPYPEIIEKKNTVLEETERLAGIIEENLKGLNSALQKYDVVSTLKVISNSIRSGNATRESVDAISLVMSSPDVESSILSLKKALSTLPNDIAVLGAVEAHRKFVEMLVVAQINLKDVQLSARQTGAVQLEEAFSYFYTNVWRFYDVQLSKSEK